MDEITALATAEKEVSLRKLFVKETAESLDIAEINVTLSLTFEGKTNEDTRKIQRQSAIAKDVECSKARIDKSKSERLLIEAEFQLTLAQKTWQASQARNEFEIARMNENASRMTLEAARLSLEAAKLTHS